MRYRREGFLNGWVWFVQSKMDQRLEARTGVSIVVGDCE